MFFPHIADARHRARVVDAVSGVAGLRELPALSGLARPVRCSCHEPGQGADRRGTLAHMPSG